MATRRGLMLGALAMAGVSPALSVAAPRPETPFAVADHHMHIQSTAGGARMKAICAIYGPGQCVGVSFEPSTGADALKALDAASIGRGVLLSTAYIAGAKELAAAPDDLARQTRAENAYVVDEARKSCGRLVAFVSVNPLAANALDEIAYWGRAGGATGLKLHLTNSDLDFTAPDQVRRLATVFGAAAKARLAIIIHMRSRSPHYGAADVETFLRDVLPAAKGVPVQIAHAAGWAGVDKPTLAALGAFAHAFETDPALTRALYFDLALTPYIPDKPPAMEDVAAFVALMRRIGVGRFLLASDWTQGFDLPAYYAREQATLGRTGDEWRTLRFNAAPYLRVETSCTPP